jgi:GABA permease
MRLCLVVANQTLMGEELLQALLARQEEGDVAFHVVVPATHPKGAWSEGSVHAAMTERLEEGRAHFAEHGIEITGEVGDANPIGAVADAMLAEHFDEIIVSTLPFGPSHWLRADVPSRLHRAHPDIPITHVVAAPVAAHGHAT